MPGLCIHEFNVIRRSLISSLLKNDAGMLDVEQDGTDQHQSCVQAVEIGLGILERAVCPRCEFCHSKNRPHHDQERRSVQDQDIAPPRNGSLQAGGGWLANDADMENGDGEDEESKEEDLNAKTNKDEVLAMIYGTGAFGIGDNHTT